ncbi:hypothetical protein Tco_0480482 [Tanacetum coccineum]
MDQRMEEPADFDLHSIPGDEVVSISGFGTDDSNEEGTVDNLTDEMTDLNTSTAKSSDPLGHLRKEIISLTTQVQRLESSITQKVAEKLEESVLDLIDESLKATLPDLISESLKLAIYEIIAESVKQTVKPMNRQFNAFNKLESSRFVTLQKELSKVLLTKMGSFIRMKVRKVIKEFLDKLTYSTQRVYQNYVHVQEMTTLMRDMVCLLDSASVFAKANAEGEKWEKEIQILKILI